MTDEKKRGGPPSQGGLTGLVVKTKNRIQESKCSVKGGGITLSSLKGFKKEGKRTQKRGPGIPKRSSHLVWGSKKNGVTIFFERKKRYQKKKCEQQNQRENNARMGGDGGKSRNRLLRARALRKQNRYSFYRKRGISRKVKRIFKGGGEALE